MVTMVTFVSVPPEQPSNVECSTCAGCGQVSDEIEPVPWSYWTSLPALSQLAVRLRIVRPVDCTACSGTGYASDPIYRAAAGIAEIVDVPVRPPFPDGR
jgi:hypothetical protein